MPMPRKPENHISIVYGLIDPRDGHLRYVGRSKQGVRRARAHLTPTNLQMQSPLAEWLRSLVADGRRPEVEILERVEGPEQLSDAEEFAVDYYRAIGCDLLNKVGGGDRQQGRGRFMTPESRARIGEANRRRQWDASTIERFRQQGHSARNLAHLRRVNESRRRLEACP